jgi:hypothetical protein
MGARTIEASEESSEKHGRLFLLSGKHAVLRSDSAKVHGKGVEPLRLAAAEPKSAASASFATRAVMITLTIPRFYSESFRAVACIWPVVASTLFTRIAHPRLEIEGSRIKDRGAMQDSGGG